MTALDRFHCICNVFVGEHLLWIACICWENVVKYAVALKGFYVTQQQKSVNMLLHVHECMFCYRTGKRTLLGLMKDGYNSAIRYYYNNFNDGFRQVGVYVLPVHSYLNFLALGCYWPLPWNLYCGPLGGQFCSADRKDVEISTGKCGIELAQLYCSHVQIGELRLKLSSLHCRSQ